MYAKEELQCRTQGATLVALTLPRPLGIAFEEKLVASGATGDERSPAVVVDELVEGGSALPRY